MKHLLTTIVVCLLMSLALLVFCPAAKSQTTGEFFNSAFGFYDRLPVVELDARDAVLALADGPAPVCVADVKDKGALHTLVFPMPCEQLIPIFAADLRDENKQAILYVTINGKHINLI